MTLPRISNMAEYMGKLREEYDKTDFPYYLDKLSAKDGAVIRDLDNENKLYHRVKESYHYIPQTGDFELWSLVNFLHNRVRINYSNTPFPHPVVLDVGAGTGAKVRMFKDCGFSAAGIEFQYEYVKAGRKAHKLSHNELLWMNAFNITEEFLEGFSVIYTYMPLHNTKRMTELHNILWQKAQLGTIFVEMLPRYYPMNMARNFGGFAVTEKASYYYD